MGINYEGPRKVSFSVFLSLHSWVRIIPSVPCKTSLTYTIWT